MVGFVLGGWIIDSYIWFWIFYINILVGLIVVGIMLVIYCLCEMLIYKLFIDKIGLVLLVIWVVVF